MGTSHLGQNRCWTGWPRIGEGHRPPTLEPRQQKSRVKHAEVPVFLGLALGTPAHTGCTSEHTWDNGQSFYWFSLTHETSCHAVRKPRPHGDLEICSQLTYQTWEMTSAPIFELAQLLPSVSRTPWPTAES